MGTVTCRATINTKGPQSLPLFYLAVGVRHKMNSNYCDSFKIFIRGFCTQQKKSNRQ